MTDDISRDIAALRESKFIFRPDPRYSMHPYVRDLCYYMSVHNPLIVDMLWNSLSSKI